MATEGKSPTPLTGVALIAALVVVATWLLMLGWLVVHTDVTEVTWARWLTVLASLEAVAFAAAGAVFGSAVQRQRVAQAEGRADKAEGRADKAEGDAKANAAAAANGRALAAAVKVRGRKPAAAAVGAGVERVAATREASDDDLAALAQRLFPD
jgi:hypothetical protein